MPAYVLRPSRNDSAKQAAAVIKLLVTRLRQAWPQVRLIVRGDSGFCRQRLIRWCERRSVGYVIGVARNARLHRHVEAWEQELESAFVREGIKQRMIREFRYAADSWNIERRVVTRLMFAALAYTLMQRLRKIALTGTELARATTATIRVKLLKIGAAILCNTRRPVSVAPTEYFPVTMTNNGVRGKSAQNSRYCSFLEQLRRQRPLAIRFACPSRG